MAYIDGFVVPVPKSKLADYRKMARKAAKIWLEHGALAVTEAVEDDVPYGQRTSFPRAVKRKDDELVIFSWIVFPSRKARDKVNAKVMADPRLASMMDLKNVPFDPKRMIFGGFKPIVEV